MTIASKTQQVLKPITVSELVEILAKLEKPTFANIVTETTVRMNKTNNPYFGLITKHTKTNILLCSDYEKRVNNNLEKEEKETDFVAKTNKVGKHISKCVLFNDKTNKYYLEYERFIEIAPTVSYTMNGEPIEKETFKDFLPPVYENKSQGDLERKVLVQSVTIDNIKEISIDKVKYIVS